MLSEVEGRLKSRQQLGQVQGLPSLQLAELARLLGGEQDVES